MIYISLFLFGVGSVDNETLVKNLRAGADKNVIIEMLLQNNYGLMWRTCSRYAKKESGLYDINDLMQEAACALYPAIDGFDASQGAFTTYFTFWIHARLKNYIYNMQPFKPGKQNYYLIAKYNRFCGDFFAKFGRDPSDTEASLFLEVTPEKLAELKKLKVKKMVLSLDFQTENEDGDTETLEPGEVDEGLQDVEHREQCRQLRNELENALDTLPKQEAEAVRVSYFSGCNEEQQRELRATVRKGLNRIRRNRKIMRRLSDYLDTRAYKIGFGSWKSGHGIDDIAISLLEIERSAEF